MASRNFLRRGPIGFRLANELEGLLRGISADGRITPDETARVEAWLHANRHFSDVRPFDEIGAHLERALADGVIDLDEVNDLLFVICKLTTVNPYFDQIRGGVQQLLGLMTGYAADAVVHPDEVTHLSAWVEAWSHLKGLWPFDECESLVTTTLARGRHGDEAAMLLALAEQFPVAGGAPPASTLTPLLISGICAVDPAISFTDRCFVFTGISSRAPRERLIEHVERRGGIHDRNVTQHTHYLVVCDEGNPLWAFACYGRKVEKAYGLRRDGHPLVIAHERDFWDAIA